MLTPDLPQHSTRAVKQPLVQAERRADLLAEDDLDNKLGVFAVHDDDRRARRGAVPRCLDLGAHAAAAVHRLLTQLHHLLVHARAPHVDQLTVLLGRRPGVDAVDVGHEHDELRVELVCEARRQAIVVREHALRVRLLHGPRLTW